MKLLQDAQAFSESQISRQMSHNQASKHQNNTHEAPILVPNLVSVSSDKGRKVTHKDIKMVQNLIERCLKLDMNRKDVVSRLFCQAKIDPVLTTFVWQKLEEENADFFRGYDIRLKLIKQIISLNTLLEEQCNLMENVKMSKVPFSPLQNGIHHGSHVCPVGNLPVRYHVIQQPPISSAGHPQIDSNGSMSSCHVGNGVPAPASFLMLPGKENIAGLVPIMPTSGINSDSSVGPASVTSTGRFQFASAEIPQLSMDTLAHDFTFPSQMASLESSLLAPDSELWYLKESFLPFAQMPGNSSDLDLATDLIDGEDWSSTFGCAK